MSAEVVLILVIGALIAWGMWLATTHLAGLFVELIAEVRQIRHLAEAGGR